MDKIKINIRKRNPIKKIKAKLKPRFQDVDEEGLRGLVGIYAISQDDGAPIEIELKGGAYNFQTLISQIGSEVTSILKGGTIKVMKVEIGDEPEQMLRDSRAGHCVGKEGLSFQLRCMAEKAPKEARRRYLNKLADEIEVYFDTKYPLGVPLDDLERYCQSKNYRIVLNMPMYGKVYDFKHPHKKAEFTFRFTNIRRDHVDLIYGEDAPITVCTKDELFEKLANLRKEGAVKILRPKRPKSHGDIKAFSFLNNRYVLEGEDILSNTEVNEYLNELRREFVDSRSPYYNFVRSGARAPCHSFTRDAYPAGSFDDANYPEDMRLLCMRDDLWSTDMHKCYRQYKNCKYFMGFPTKPSHMRYNISFDEAKGYAGWWLIRQGSASGTIPHISHIDGLVWTTPDLLFFHDNGLTFEIEFGCWDHSPKLDIEFPTDKVTYCIFSGMLHREVEYSTAYWYDDSDLMTRDIQHNGLKLQRSRHDNWRSGCNFSGYIYAYARIQVHEMALRHRDVVVGIAVDALVTTSPLVIDGGIDPVDGKPIWSAPQPKTYCEYIAPSDQYPAGMNRRPDLKLPVLEGEYEHAIPDGDILLTGLGGGGKSYSILKQLGWLAPTYIGPTLALLDEKRLDGWLYWSTPNRFPVDRDEKNPNRKAYLKYDVPKIIFVDEVNITPYLKDIMEKCKQYGIRVIFAGDEAQIRSSYSMPDLWNVLRANVRHELNFKTDRRSKDPHIKILKARVREIVLSGESNANKVEQIFQIMRYVRRPKKEQWQTLPLIKLYAHDEDQHGVLPEGQTCITIDKMQGQTVHTPHICVINKGTRTDQLPELIYTMVSRFTRITDLYVVDTSIKEN